MRGLKTAGKKLEPIRFRVPVTMLNKKYEPVEFDRYSYYKHRESVAASGAFKSADALLRMDERDRMLSDHYANLLSNQQSQQLLCFMQPRQPLKAPQLQALRRQVHKHGFHLEMLNGRLFKGQLLSLMDHSATGTDSREEVMGLFNMLEGCGGMFILYPKPQLATSTPSEPDLSRECVGEQVRRFLKLQQQPGQPSLAQAMMTMGARVERNLFGPAELIDYSRRIHSRQMVMGSLLGVISHPVSQMAGMLSHWPQQLSMSLSQHIKQQQDEQTAKP